MSDTAPIGESRPEPPKERRRSAALAIFSAVPILYFLGIAGVHGGGFATAVALAMALISVLVGLAVAIFGLSPTGRSRGWWFIRVYLALCVLVGVAAAWDLFH
jgi:hypothetical protein